MSDNFTYWHLDGTQCVAGWNGDTGECVLGGGAVTPRAFEGEPPSSVGKVKVLMVGYWDLTRVEPVGLFTDEKSASDCLRWWMKNRKQVTGFYSIQPYHIGQQYGSV